MPPSRNERVAKLIEIGFLPENAVALVTRADSLVDDSDMTALLDTLYATTDDDKLRASVFVLYSDVFPDWMKRLWEARVIA
jgi:hypothetical protein